MSGKYSREEFMVKCCYLCLLYRIWIESQPRSKLRKYNVLWQLEGECTICVSFVFVGLILFSKFNIRKEILNVMLFIIITVNESEWKGKLTINLSHLWNYCFWKVAVGESTTSLQYKKKLQMKTGSLLSPLSKIEFVRKQDCIWGFNHKSNVGRCFKKIF